MSLRRFGRYSSELKRTDKPLFGPAGHQHQFPYEDIAAENAHSTSLTEARHRTWPVRPPQSLHRRRVSDR